MPVTDRQLAVLERYREARTLGEALLRLLQPSLTEADQDEIDRLVRQRAAAIEAAAQLNASVEGDGQVLSELAALIQQQQVIESQIRRVMAAWQQSTSAVLLARGDLRGVRRLLRPMTQPNLLNERR